MTPSAELLPCPFCGLTEHLSMRAEGSYTPDMPARPYRVVCNHIDHDTVEGPIGYGRKGASLAWNRREAATALSEAKAENERVTRERDAFFDSLRRLICINSVLTALRSTAPLWLEHAERLIDERNAALNPKGGDNGEA